MFTYYDRAKMGCSDTFNPKLRIAHKVLANRGTRGIICDYLTWAAEARLKGNFELARNYIKAIRQLA